MINSNRKIADKIMQYVIGGAASISIVVLIGIFMMLMYNGINLFFHVNPVEFFFGESWNPSSYTKAKFGIIPLLAGSFLVTILAMMIAVPIGIGAAAFLAELASPQIRKYAKPCVELLAGIPSVAVGFFGLVVIGPFIVDFFNVSSGLNALNGAILLAFMSLPTIISVADDAISSVPKQFKEASYALGANKWETIVKVVLPSSMSGIIAAVILGFGRAIGETMTVLMVTGNTPLTPTSIFDSVLTITATIAIEMGEVPYGTPHYYSLYALGALLFAISMVINYLAEMIASKFRYKI